MSLGDTALLEELGALLAERADGRGVAALAFRPAPDHPLDVTWTPAGSEREPGFPAYSITKIYTATLILKLVDEGRLALDDHLDGWFPAIDRADQITLRQLLAHTAGIPDYGGLAAYHEAVRSSPGRPWSFDEYATHTWERGLDFEPGSTFAYSNPGYLLLARIAGEATGASYRELIAQRIAKPLRLERTFVPEEIADWESLAPGISRLLDPGFEPVDARRAYHPGWVSHGVIASTASEVLCFCEALFAGRLVSREALEEMTRLRPIGREVDGLGEPGYGLGLMGDGKSRFGRTLGHNGGGPGYTTSVFHAPDLPGGAATVCVMSAIEGGEFAGELVQEVIGRIAGSRD